MNKLTVVAVVIAVLLTGKCAMADLCPVVNGDFEDDGWIEDIVFEEPNGWDVNLPADKFGGKVYQEWIVGDFSLMLYSLRYADFDANDIALVSQQDVNLWGIGGIIFDLKLETYPSIRKWDPNECTAVMMIDEDVVWESSNASSDVRGEYIDQVCVVEDKYRDEGLHRLALGLRVNVAERLSTAYITQWDNIGCGVICGGGDYLAADFDRNCYVDANDLSLLADVWLGEVEPDDIRNLFIEDGPGGMIDFFDFVIFAEQWLLSSYPDEQPLP